MKTIKLTVIMTAASIVLSASAQAENGKPQRDRKPPKPLLEKFDKDGDGKLSKEERQAMRTTMQARRAEMKKKMLERFDTDKDGELSEEEREIAKEAIAKERGEIKKAVLAKFDKNGNGKLEQDEREGVREWVKENYPDAIPPRPKARKGKGSRGKQRGGPDGKRKGPAGKQRGGA